MINWGNFKCRCSAIHKIMADSKSNPSLTEKQAVRLEELEARDKLTDTMMKELAELRVKKENSSKIILSDTAIEYLMEVYSWETTGKVPVLKEFDLDQIRKGKEVEDASIALLSVVDGVVYDKNEERVANDYLSGIPDIFIGDSIMQARRITDIKTSFDYPEFLKKVCQKLSNGWQQQVRGYLDITGAPEGEIGHCLVDMPPIMISDYKRRLFFKGEYATEESPEFKEKWQRLERSMKFGDIPIHKRVYRVPIEPFSEFERQKLYDRVKICREWLWEFDEMYENINKNYELASN